MTDFALNKTGGVASPSGFQSVAAKAGIKTSGEADMALVVSEQPAAAAGAFTSNEFAASSVRYNQEVLQNPDVRIRALFVNSGCANACTGRRGDKDTRSIAELVAEALEVERHEVLVCSTGRIGSFLPMSSIKKAVENVAGQLSKAHADSGLNAARAIMTTDTRPKSVALTLNLAGKTVTIGGMCKGAGMIAPQFKPVVPHATMLAFLTTDANVESSFLSECLEESLSESFNRITVDGDSSTNDSVIALANGCSATEQIDVSHPEAGMFKKGFSYVMQFLAEEIVRDGEGATRFVEVQVKEAASAADAKKCAHAVADSMLCKTAWFGGDPNWGRILAAAGCAGVRIEPGKTGIKFNGVPAVVNGIAAETKEEELRGAVEKAEIRVELTLGCGWEEYTAWTCDLSYDYVKINAEYHT